MNIVYITSMLPLGSAEAFLIPEIEELKRLDHRVLIVPMRHRGKVVHQDAQRILSDCIPIPLLSPAIARAALLQMARAPRAALWACRIILRSAGWKNLLKNVLVFPKALWLARTIRRVRADHIHAHWAGATATMALVASAISRVPWSFTAHSLDLRQKNLLAEKTAGAEFVRVVSRTGFEELTRYIGEPSAKLHVIHMGVEVPAFPCRFPKPGSSLRLLVPASLDEVKGHEILLRSAAILRSRAVDAHFDCVGDGPLRRRLQAHTKRLKLQQIRFLGVLSHTELMGRLQAGEWNAVVLASIVTADGEREGIPVSLMEAMAVGVPVIATDTGGIPELLAQGAGLIVPQRDANALADAIASLARNPELTAALGAAGRRRIRDHFSISKVMDDLLHLIEPSSPLPPAPDYSSQTAAR